MTIELSLSIMHHNEGTLVRIQEILRRTRQTADLNVSCREMEYDSGWSEFVRMAIHGGNLDVSEMGTTWISDFAAMNAVRPFTAAEIRSLGGAEAFAPALWRTGLGEKDTVWAIPWMTDLRLVYYRRDLLRKAGLEAARAFSTPELFAETLAALKEAGVERPWAAPTEYSHIALHSVAMWLWSQNADFLDASGRQVQLNHPEARRGVELYLGLQRFLGPAGESLSDAQANWLFHTGGAAVTISGPWLYRLCPPDLLEEVGLAVPLAHAFLGGSSLVIWESSRGVPAAIRLLGYLCGDEIQDSLPLAAGLLPARPAVLDRRPFAGDAELNRVIAQAMQSGRTLPCVPLWGMIEDRLARVFASLCESLRRDPQAEVPRLLDEQLVPEVNRLNTALTR